MSTANEWPVDSTTRTCCGGIGRHTRDCTAPADATHVDQWADLDDDGQLQRHFTGTRHGEHVRIIGLQHATGPG